MDVEINWSNEFNDREIDLMETAITAYKDNCHDVDMDVYRTLLDKVKAINTKRHVAFFASSEWTKVGSN